MAHGETETVCVCVCVCVCERERERESGNFNLVKLRITISPIGFAQFSPFFHSYLTLYAALYKLVLHCYRYFFGCGRWNKVSCDVIMTHCYCHPGIYTMLGFVPYLDYS